jgi:uncharacterized membrane protein YqaE (UPF0057 family)
MYLLAILLPPLAVLLCGKPFQFILNLILTLFFWFPGAIHACFVVSTQKADERNQRLINAIQSSGRNAVQSSSPPLLPSAPSKPSTIVKVLAVLVVIGGLGFAGLIALAIGFSNLEPGTQKSAGDRETASAPATPSKPTQSATNAPVAGEKKGTEAVKPASTLPKHLIIEDTSMGTIKRTVDVRLEQKITEDELRRLGEAIKRNGRKNYERVFITYYLPHQTPGSGAWATTHFDPNIDVRVLGFGADEVPTPQQTDAQKADRVGRWEYSDAIGQVFTISRVGTGFSMTVEFKGGGKVVERVTAQREGERVIISPAEPKDSGDYWILDEQKNLLLMDSEGLIGKAMAISE